MMHYRGDQQLLTAEQLGNIDYTSLKFTKPMYNYALLNLRERKEMENELN
jgi:hypothetical protein